MEAEYSLRNVILNKSMTVDNIKYSQSLYYPFKDNFLKIIYKSSFRTSQETHYVSATKTIRLMLFRETVPVYFENHTEHRDPLCGQIAEF
jgi:hypothetical protein